MEMKKQDKWYQICVHKSGWDGYNHKWADQVYWNMNTMKDYHVNVRKFSDIAYHFVIERDGTLMEGRDINYCPASSKGHNDNVIAICLIGEFTREEPTQDQLDVLQNLILHLTKTYIIPSGVTPKDSTDMHHIFCHCDYRDPAGNRYCPGKYLHSKVPMICREVHNLIENEQNYVQKVGEDDS